MNPLKIVCLVTLLSLSHVFNCKAQSGQNSPTSQSPKLDLAQLRSVPDGNYLVTLELNGKSERLNLKIQGNRGKCVNSSDPELKGLAAEFQPYPRQDGAFVARLRGGKFVATQLWIFRTDAIAAIRETPDRGEIQSAVPVSGDSIDLPKGK